jgi:tetratricopeptide (TPR) repeat protein
LAAYNKALQLSPKQFFLLFARADVLKKLLRYEEANAKYDRLSLSRLTPGLLHMSSRSKKRAHLAPAQRTVL